MKKRNPGFIALNYLFQVKKIVHKSKNIFLPAKAITLLVMLLFLMAASAQAKTTTWKGKKGGNWTQSKNWTFGVPAGNDIVIINSNQSRNITSVPTISLFSLTINGNCTLVGASSNKIITVGGITGTNFTISTGKSLTLGSNLNITLANSATASIDGTLIIGSGLVFNSDGSSVVTTVNGSINNSGTLTCSNATRLLFQSGSSYIHSQDGGIIPTATWNAASTCMITGVTANSPLGFSQSFGHFTWNCTGQTAGIALNSDFTVKGNFTLTSSGTDWLILTNNATSRTLTIQGNYVQTGGKLDFSSGNYGAASYMYLAGNFTSTAAVYTISTQGPGAVNGSIIFNGTNPQTLSFTNSGAALWVKYIVNAGSNVTLGSNLDLFGDAQDPIYYADVTVNGTLTLGNYIINETVGAAGATHFALNAGAGLLTSNTGGIAASIPSANMVKSFSSAASYTFNGTAAQATGTFTTVPSAYTVNNLTINNTTGVSLSQPFTVANTLALSKGILSIGSNNSLVLQGSVNGSNSIAGGSTSNLTVEGSGANLTLPPISGGLNTFTVNRANGVTLGNNLTVAGALDLISGALTLNGKTLALNGTISGTGTLTGDVNAVLTLAGTAGGNLGKILFSGLAEKIKTLTLNRTGTSPSVTIGSNLAVGSGGLTISSGVLTVDYNKALTVTGNSTLNYTASPCLVLKSNATGTASFIDNGISGTGTATVERFLTKYRVVNDGMYHFLSSPVSGQSIVPMFGNPPTNTTDDFYKLDESTYTWINLRAAGNGLNPLFEATFTRGRGYLVAYNTDATRSFTGPLNTGTLTSGTGLPALTYTTAIGSSAGWNLVGNPYPSAISWDNVSAAQSMNLDNAVYVYDNASQQYKTYVGGIGSLTNGIIPAMQGFLVKAHGASPSLILENQDRIQGGAVYYKSRQESSGNVLTLKVEGNAHSDETSLRFMDGATTGFNTEWDAYKLMGDTKAPNLYTVTGNLNYAVNTLPPDAMNSTVPVSFIAGTPGTYTITAEGTSLFAAGIQIRLEDKKTGTSSLLNDSPVYSFTSAAGDDTDRFVLNFMDVTAIPEPEPIAGETFDVFQNNGTLTITTKKPVYAEIIVTNILGQVVMRSNTYGNANSVLKVSRLKNGIYVISLMEKRNKISEKIIINN